MLTVAVTGGIGSGKTAVTQLFTGKGIPSTDADQIARELSAVDGLAYPAICEHFGSTILNDDKTINRKQLGKIIFSTPEERHWLEMLLHPLIVEQMQRVIGTFHAPYCILEIPLLAELGRRPWIDRVLVIDAPSRVRIERIRERDNLPMSEVNNIICSQSNRKKRLQIADDVIDNSGSLEELTDKVTQLHEYYLLLSKSVAG